MNLEGGQERQKCRQGSSRFGTKQKGFGSPVRKMDCWPSVNSFSSTALGSGVREQEKEQGSNRGSVDSKRSAAVGARGHKQSHRSLRDTKGFSGVTWLWLGFKRQPGLVGLGECLALFLPTSLVTFFFAEAAEGEFIAEC